MTAAVPKFSDVKVGDPIKPIVLPPITRHQLALYCGGSGDHNPIHVDLDFAKKFGFKDVFAHGMLSMGFLGRLVTSYAPRDRITCQQKVVDMYDKKGGALWFVVSETSMKDQSGKLVAKGTGITVVRNPDADKK